MATTHFQGIPDSVDNMLIGYTVGGVRETIERGQPVWFGTDANSSTQRINPVSDITAHQANGLALNETANMLYTKDVMAVALPPFTIITDNVDSSNPPEAVLDNEIYIMNNGTFSDADGDSAGHSNGYCIKVISSGKYSGMYQLRITTMDTS